MDTAVILLNKSSHFLDDGTLRSYHNTPHTLVYITLALLYVSIRDTGNLIQNAVRDTDDYWYSTFILDSLVVHNDWYFFVKDVISKR
jgi:hypothetical protein